MRFLVALLATALVTLLTACVAPVTEAPDLILSGGKIFTANEAAPWAEAVAIAGDRILAVGSDEEILALRGGGTRVIELGGRVVVPGINDAHRHFGLLPLDSHPLELTPLEPSSEEVKAAIRAAADKHPAGTWIEGIIGATVMTDPSIDRDVLDALAPDHPVHLATFYGHGEILNSRALTALGVSDTLDDPLGGFFEREPGSKRVNGRLFEYPQWNLAKQRAERIPDDAILEALRAEERAMLAVGITSMHIMPTLPLERYVTLLAEADPRVRVQVIRFPGTNGSSRLVEEGREAATPPGASKKIEITGIKWILDGTPLERGAAMRESYRDRQGEKGRLNFPPEEVSVMLRESLDAEEQLLLHAVGDHAIDVVLTAMEAMPDVDWPSRRLRIEHGDGLLPDLLSRAARLGVVVVQNPTHFALPVVAEQRWRMDDGFQPLRSVIDAGVPLALGSDGPPNPWLDVLLATVHPASPGEAITVEQAIIAYTRGAAFAQFAEDHKGTLAIGKLADLAVLSQDVFSVPPDRLPATLSVLTIIGGEVVHDTGALD